MSRLDQALARARAFQSEELVVPEVAAVESGELFSEDPTETVELPLNMAPAAREARAEPAPPVKSGDNGSSGRLLDASGDLASLPAREKLVGGTVDQRSIEQYRRVAARLCIAQVERGTRLLMVTSAMPGEGKTLTATNLALTLSESYKRRVLLLDADLRRPCLHQLFQVPNLTGFNDGMGGSDTRKVPVIQFTEHLSLITAGRPDSDPMSILSSDRMRLILDEARKSFDWVIVDTPPVGLLTDAHLLVSLVDAVLLVVQAGRTPLASVQKAITAVGRERLMGVVLNRADDALSGVNYGYEEAYARPA
jgi:capsular exopolysaccharide synthesis family protein